MKIGIEIQPLLEEYMTGVGWYTDYLIKGLRDYGSSEDIFYLLGLDFHNRAERLRGYTSNNVQLKTHGLMHYGIYRRVWKLMPMIDYGRFFRVKADVYHFVNFIVPPYVKGKVAVTVYDMVYKLFPETMEKANYMKLENNLLSSCNRADTVITISENSKREIHEYLGVPLEKISIVSPGVDTAIYHPHLHRSLVEDAKTKYSLPGKYFLYLGTLEPRKNIETIIEAFRIYKSRRHSSHKLVIAGKKGWMYEKIFAMVKKYNLENAVIFPGYVEEQDKPYLYQGATAFIYPSLYEGFGMPPLEAMACGTPVIASNTSSLPEVVADAGFLTDPLDAEAIAGYMHDIDTNWELAERMGEKGHIRAGAFSWEKSVQDLLKVYRGLA